MFNVLGKVGTHDYIITIKLVIFYIFCGIHWTSNVWILIETSFVGNIVGAIKVRATK